MYLRHTIPTTGRRDVAQVLEAVAGLDRAVAVNIVSADETSSAFFCAENLQRALADGPESVLVEALPLSEYKAFMRGVVGQVVRAALGLRATLRTSYVAAAAEDVRAVCAQVDRLLLLLDGYQIQADRAVIGKLLGQLRDRRAELERWSFEARDNVLCMDNLHHELLPALTEIGDLFAE